MKELVKKLIHMLCGDYSIYYIYSQSHEDLPTFSEKTTTFSVKRVDAAAIESSADSLIREQVGYTGADTRAYACFDNDRIVGVCFYWFGNRYLERNFWPLANREAKLVQIISLPDMRGCGVATLLVSSSFRDMMRQKFHRIYARIWHSNIPSLRAFERAGWARIALVFEINPLRQKNPIRVHFNYMR